MTFDQPVSIAGATVSFAGNNAQGALDLSAITASITQPTSAVVEVDFNQALPDVARYRLQLNGVTDLQGNALSGDNSCVITALKGDVSGDCVVNSTDLTDVKSAYTRQVNVADVAEVAPITAWTAW